MINDKLHTEEALNLFAKLVIRDAKKGLKSFSNLAHSLDKKVLVHPNSFTLIFEAAHYADWHDEGVRGKDPSKVSKNAKIRGQQAPKSQYRFGSGKTKNFKGFKSNILRWMRGKQLRFRDEKGRFVIGNQKGMAHVIASNIYWRGLKPSLFFTKPFRKHFEQLTPKLEEAYALDAEAFIETTFRDHLK